MRYSTSALLLSLLLLSGAARAQSLEVPNFEYAKDLCELREENRVFVHAPLSTREKIVKELRHRSDLFIVERPEEADFLLLFTYTPFADGSQDGNPLEANGPMAARAELTVVKFIKRSEEQVRPRILFFWSEQKSFHSVPIPLRGLSLNGFAMPRSGKSAATELIARLTLWAIHKRWPRNFYFDQFTNQLTISMGGKFEVDGTKAFLKELKTARGDAYMYKCARQPALLPAEGAIPKAPMPRIVIPDSIVTADRPPSEVTLGHPLIQNRPMLEEGRPRFIKRSRKRRKRH
jgi:hypothetical protein